MINTIQTALSGLAAASKKIEAGASNIANLTTEGSLEDPAHPPYSAVTTVQAAAEGGGVQADIVRKNPPYVPAYDPGSPFAGQDGAVGIPNVDLAEEAVNLSLAKTAYKASLSVIKTADEMQEELLKAFDKRV